MTRRVLAVASVAVALCGGCGGSSGGGKSGDRVQEAAVRDVKLGMTRPQVIRLLGQPDEKNELYGLPEQWVDWLWDTDDGRSSVTFSKAGRVTRIHDCPHGVCTYVPQQGLGGSAPSRLRCNSRTGSRVQTDGERGWRSVLTVDEDGPVEAIILCPICAEPGTRFSPSWGD
jgi:hypothetical protein